MNGSKRSATMVMAPLVSSKMDQAVALVLRMPGLFIIDHYFRNLMHRPTSTKRWNLLLSNFVLLNGLLLLLLPLSRLKRYYPHLLCFLLLFESFCFSLDLFSIQSSRCRHSTLLFYLQNENLTYWTSTSSGDNIWYLPFAALHLTFDLLLNSLLQLSSYLYLFGCLTCAFPIAGHYFALSTNNLKILNLLSCVIFCFKLSLYINKYLPVFLRESKHFLETLITTSHNEGLNFLCLKTMKKIFVPVHFLTFWTVTLACQLYLQSGNDRPNEHRWYLLLSSFASATYLSPVSLLSTAITVTYLSCFLLSLLKLYLWGDVRGVTANLVDISGHRSRDHNGWEEGMTTLLLTTITAVTDMNENVRTAVLIIISFVVLSSLLQSMLEISEPAILSLNSSYATDRVHHLKVLLLCTFIFGFPLYVTYVLAQIFPINFWIAVVFSTSLLISARVLDLVVVHCLFWWDSCQQQPWEYLDEVVYFCRAFTKVLEFFIAISVVVVGVWEAMQKRANLVNSSILILHCYFNVWQRINDGLRSYCLRREANRIVTSMHLADSFQIGECNDLCSICFVELVDSASQSVVVMTKCNHLFHRLCIKKWLCIQTRCPLCAFNISTTSENSNPSSPTYHATTTTTTTCDVTTPSKQS